MMGPGWGSYDCPFGGPGGGYGMGPKRMEPRGGYRMGPGMMGPGYGRGPGMMGPGWSGGDCPRQSDEEQGSLAE